MMEYRAGRFDIAADCLLKSAETETMKEARATPQLYLAMAYYRMGRTEEARVTLADAVRRVDGQVARVGDPDLGTYVHEWMENWLICQIARREAESLIEGKAPAPPLNVPSRG
jgi:hypothetical protein